jgi:hypothetical protein
MGMKGKKCKCGGKFQELSIYDDWDGKVTCNKCNIRVDSDPEKESVKKNTGTKSLLTSPLKMIHLYTETERLFLLDQICAEIYIARNISLDQQTILDNFARIDKLYRTPSEGEEYES